MDVFKEWERRKRRIVETYDPVERPIPSGPHVQWYNVLKKDAGVETTIAWRVLVDDAEVLVRLARKRLRRFPVEPNRSVMFEITEMKIEKETV